MLLIKCYAEGRWYILGYSYKSRKETMKILREYLAATNPHRGNEPIKEGTFKVEPPTDNDGWYQFDMQYQGISINPAFHPLCHQY